MKKKRPESEREIPISYIPQDLTGGRKTDKKRTGEDGPSRDGETQRKEESQGKPEHVKQRPDSRRENDETVASSDADRIRLLDAQESGPASSTDSTEGVDVLEGVEAAEDVEMLETAEAVAAEKERNLAQEYLEHLQRLQAEFANYRKRAIKEIRESCDSGKAELVCKLLPVLDDMERALANLTPDCNPAEAVKGVRLIYEKLRSILQAEGLDELQCKGQPFDPNVQEAVVVTRLKEGTDGEVLRDFEKGYTFKGKLVRPSKVEVAQVESEEGKEGEGIV